jgi:hypothetical protein
VIRHGKEHRRLAVRGKQQVGLDDRGVPRHVLQIDLSLTVAHRDAAVEQQGVEVALFHLGAHGVMALRHFGIGEGRKCVVGDCSHEFAIH